MTLLRVEDLCIDVGAHPVVRNVSFEVKRGQTLGIVGESGCGKSITALAVMGLLHGSQIRITGGEIFFNGRDLLQMPFGERRALMGSQLAMIFQEPMSSLNPVYRIGEQIVEMIRQHQKIRASDARARALELLQLVQVPDPGIRLHAYPHMLSGGLRQRVMIAIALACSPMLLIADEPTTALDVTVQAQILTLLRRLQNEIGMAVMLISHDLGVIAQNCQSVAVMYRGRIIERAPTTALFRVARHPYTAGLMALIPDARTQPEELVAIPGSVPPLHERISGCGFHPRCAFADTVCREQSPPPQMDSGHLVLCHHPCKAER